MGPTRFTKQPSEQFGVTVDFTPRLVTGETIVTPACTARNEATSADTTDTVLAGSATAAGALVTRSVHAGVDGERHVLTFRATTSLNNIFEHDVVMVVMEQ